CRVVGRRAPTRPASTAPNVAAQAAGARVRQPTAAIPGLGGHAHVFEALPHEEAARERDHPTLREGSPGVAACCEAHEPTPRLGQPGTLRVELPNGGSIV